ncbi:MAG: hypothetical protein ACRD9L_10165 [Bryobacteraceae bacterium]
MTRLTVNEPIQVQDKLLEPGQYVFKLADSNSNRHVVQIFNGDQSQIIDTILAVPNYRLQPEGDSRFSFYETPPGAAKALRAWFYPGDNSGQEFRYPKHLAMISTPAAAAPPEPAPVAAPPQETPAPAPAPEQSMTQPAQQEPPAQVAQNNPTAETPAPVQQAQSAPAPQEHQELPKTASPYPLFGFGGLFCLGLYSLLRLKRVA